MKEYELRVRVVAQTQEEHLAWCETVATLRRQQGCVDVFMQPLELTHEVLEGSPSKDAVEGDVGMYEVKKYGGRRIRNDDSSCLIFQFDTLENMEAWMTMMRTWYTPDQTAWHANKEALIVAL